MLKYNYINITPSGMNSAFNQPSHFNGVLELDYNATDGKMHILYDGSDTTELEARILAYTGEAYQTKEEV